MSNSASITIAPLEQIEEALWAAFLETADHATLFHDLRFLAYHPPGRFRFHHLVARRAGGIVALLPGGLAERGDATMYCSPLGASVGGPALRPDLAAKDVVDLIAALQAHAREQGWSGIEMTLPPAEYEERPSDTLSFALFFHGFRLTNRWLCPMIPLAPEKPEQYRALFRDTYANRVRAGRNKGISVTEAGIDQVENFLVVFRDTYGRRGASPTHGPDEIADLLRRFPDRIRLYVALLEGEPIAGVMVFLLNPKVGYTFYICTSASHARENGSVVIFASLIDWLAERGYRWIDLGPTAKGGNFDEGITFFKEGLGTTSHCRDQWRWSAG